MIEYFNRSGKIPDEMGLLQMCVIGEHIYLTLIFNNFVLISSYVSACWSTSFALHVYIAIIFNVCETLSCHGRTSGVCEN